MPLFKTFQLFWLKCWYSRKQHQTERLNSLFSQKEFITRKGEAKHFHQAVAGTAPYFSSMLTSLWARNFPFLRSRRAHHSALIVAQVLVQLLLSLTRDATRTSNLAETFSTHFKWWGDQEHTGTQNLEVGRKLQEGGEFFVNLKGTCANAAQLCSKSMTMKSGGSIARHALVALCSAGLKQHQECKKSLLHHQAV